MSLVVEHLSITFGGLRAVDDVTFGVPTGSVVGLIGPNGAGKSTTFDAISGLNRPAAGSIRFGDVELMGEPAVARAAVGIGRTFQRMELFDSLTVAENVAIGREANLAGRSPARHIFAASSERSTVQAATTEALQFCGIDHLADLSAGTLSTGQRRLVELGRCVAGDFSLLLLDEPSSGLDSGESEHLGSLLRRLVAERAIGILIVEHDMSLIADVCDYVYVLDFGQLLFEGRPDEVLSSEVVRAAYLGNEPIPVGEAV